jgi:hypothetical protein
MDETISPSDWTDGNIMKRKYQRTVLTNDDGTPHGNAIIDAVVPAMLENRGMWAKP